MQRLSSLIALALLAGPLVADAQVSRARSNRTMRPRPLSADTRAAVRKVMEAHQRLRQPSELQQLAIEIAEAKRLLPDVMGARRQKEVAELRDRTRRMRALLRVVKAKSKAPAQPEFAGSLPLIEERCRRLFAALDGIADAKTPEERTLRAQSLYTELALAAPDPHQDDVEPAIHTDLPDPGEYEAREVR